MGVVLPAGLLATPTNQGVHAHPMYTPTQAMRTRSPHAKYRGPQGTMAMPQKKSVTLGSLAFSHNFILYFTRNLHALFNLLFFSTFYRNFSKTILYLFKRKTVTF
jgi:hypothetical protein